MLQIEKIKKKERKQKFQIPSVKLFSISQDFWKDSKYDNKT